MMENRRAFTLIEMMIVVAMLGILVVVAIPFIMRYMDRFERQEVLGEINKYAPGIAVKNYREEKDQVIVTVADDNCATVYKVKKVDGKLDTIMMSFHCNNGDRQPSYATNPNLKKIPVEKPEKKINERRPKL